MIDQQTIGVAGLGLLGRGIVACLRAHGFRVIARTTGTDTHAHCKQHVGAPGLSSAAHAPRACLQRTRREPGRFLGKHWAQPAYATRFLELIRGNLTSEAAMQRATVLGRAVGKDPVIVQKDVTGFITNRLGYAMYREALHLLQAGVADVETIDRSFGNACGLWASFSGSFRWMDITGVPSLYAKAMQTVLPDLANSASLPPLMPDKRASGEQGVLDGRGF